MALGKFGPRDWFAGFLVTLASGAGKSNVYVPAATLVDSTGVPVSFGGSGATSMTVQGAGAAGSAVVGAPVLQGGSDGTNTRTITTDTAGNQLVLQPAVISAVNSSTTPLAANGVFTGTGMSTLNYGAIIVNIFADQASAAGGLSVQQSSNGTNWDATDTYTISASTALKVVIPRQAAFARIVYTNGATLQGAFRLQTLLSPQMPTASAVSPGDGVTTVNDFAETVAVPMLYNGTTLDMQRTLPGAANTGLGTGAIGLTKLSGSQLTKQTVNITSGTSTAVIAGTAAQFVRVYRIMLNFAATQTLDIRSSGGTSLVGAAMSFGANGGLVLDFDGEPWLTTLTGEGLTLVTTTTGAVNGVVYYVKAA